MARNFRAMDLSPISMTTKEKQLKFWTALKESDINLFSGTPSECQYYNIVNKDILPLKIRLDIYCCEEDYRDKGYLTVCVMLPEDKLQAISNATVNEKCCVEQKISRFLWVSNRDCACLIGDNEKDWKNAIDWFSENVKNIVNTVR